MKEVKKYGACTEKFLPFDTKKVREEPSEEAYEKALNNLEYVKKLTLYKLKNKADEVLKCI